MGPLTNGKALEHRCRSKLLSARTGRAFEVEAHTNVGKLAHGASHTWTGAALGARPEAVAEHAHHLPQLEPRGQEARGGEGGDLDPWCMRANEGTKNTQHPAISPKRQLAGAQQTQTTARHTVASRALPNSTRGPAGTAPTRDNTCDPCVGPALDPEGLTPNGYQHDGPAS